MSLFANQYSNDETGKRHQKTNKILFHCDHGISLLIDE
ncbi:hypothetical protein PPIS_a1206 [Pseudoalteromonas piscicida]|uniref:Uncharacterized protein n=1 Tax=Pseudoalteromonas piscicida TaxID=43662 RepID=A0ABN5C9T6_PSEO7|nr:hypothetical protein PPIS_a1206 [Pseudoalteromonas piscicida]